MFDQQPTVEPAAGNSISVWKILRQIKRVELELGLNAVPAIVIKYHVLAVVEIAVESASQRPLCQTVRRVLVLHVGRRQTQPSADRFDI